MKIRRVALVLSIDAAVISLRCPLGLSGVKDRSSGVFYGDQRGRIGSADEEFRNLNSGGPYSATVT